MELAYSTPPPSKTMKPSQHKLHQYHLHGIAYNLRTETWYPPPQYLPPHSLVVRVGIMLGMLFATARPCPSLSPPAPPPYGSPSAPPCAPPQQGASPPSQLSYGRVHYQHARSPPSGCGKASSAPLPCCHAPGPDSIDSPLCIHDPENQLAV